MIFQDSESEDDLIPMQQTDSGAFITIVHDQSGVRYFMMIEGRVVRRDVTSVSEAATFILIYHHVFNLKYSAPLTLEFLQCRILSIGMLDKKPPHKISYSIHAIDNLLDV